MDSQIARRVREIEDRLKACAAEKWGRTPELIAVTKTVPAETVNALLNTDIRRIGENRAQEIMEKYPSLHASFSMDCIGRLQTNKVKYIIDKVGMIESLDRMNLAQEIDRRAQQIGRRMPVLIQINIGKEPQKGGIPEEEMLPFVRAAAKLQGIEIRGLMAVMPQEDDPALLRPLFKRMRSLFELLRSEAVQGTSVEELSMGMSGDYEIAAGEGATHVRIGSAVFGSRAAARA